MSFEANTPNSLPDDQALYQEFKKTSYAAFVTAFSRLVDGEVDPAFLGKPVNMLRFNITRQHEQHRGWGMSNPVAAEILALVVVRPQVLHEEVGLAALADMTVEDQEIFKQTVDAVDAVVVEKGMPIAEKIPSPAIWADYRAIRSNPASNSDVRISTLDFSGYSVKGGLFFARDALAYVSSPRFVTAARQVIPYEAGTEGAAALDSIDHSLSLVLTPALGNFLNGHESRAFLESFRTSMLKRYTEACARLDRGDESDAQRELVVQYEVALFRVNEILESRND